MSREIVSGFESGEQLAKQAAKDLAQHLHELLKLQPQVNLVLTGGTVGIKTLEELAGLLSSSDLSKLQVWWGDERFVASDSADRNELQARQALISKINLPEANIHAMPALGILDLDAAAELFSTQIEAINPRFDVILLGMGPDAHVASLFPNSRAKVHGKWVVSESNSPKPPSQRISLSYLALNSADQVWFLVSGIDKSEAVSKVFEGQDLPASKVTGTKKTRWYLDSAAASKITS